jgi:hypothetical protein
MMLCAGCTTVVQTTQTGPPSYHLGLVKIVTSASGEQRGIESTTIQTLGGRIQDGFTLGYLREKRLTLPLNCRVVLIVQTDAQLDRANVILNSLKGEQLCIAQEQD